MSKKDVELFGDIDFEEVIEEAEEAELIEEVVEEQVEEEVKIEMASPAVTSIRDYSPDRPEFANMTDVAIREWLAKNPNVPNEEKINGHEVRVWKLARKFNRSVEEMAKLIAANPNVL